MSQMPACSSVTSLVPHHQPHPLDPDGWLGSSSAMMVSVLVLTSSPVSGSVILILTIFSIPIVTTIKISKNH